MIKSWMVIGAVAFLVAFVGGKITPSNNSWFRRLRRPDWLTFEWAIPFIWSFIFICGIISASLVWEQDPGSGQTWYLMAVYLLVEVLILAYTPVMFLLRSLMVGVIIGAIGSVCGVILTLKVQPVSVYAALLLLPYIIWSPIGTYVTWEMCRLNPRDA